MKTKQDFVLVVINDQRKHAECALFGSRGACMKKRGYLRVIYAGHNLRFRIVKFKRFSKWVKDAFRRGIDFYHQIN